MALYAFEVDTGLEPGPFDQKRAERYALELLLPDEDFTVLADLPDRELADLVGIPEEQVRLRRLGSTRLPTPP
jgi:hypothetical protein